jgi:hypothetical protein
METFEIKTNTHKHFFKPGEIVHFNGCQFYDQKQGLYYFVENENGLKQLVKKSDLKRISSLPIFNGFTTL